MKILYSLPHTSDRLDVEGAGHTVRANAILNALESLGAEVIRDQAARESGQTAVQAYRQLVRKLIPRPLAMYMRDRGRVTFGRMYGQRLTEAVRRHKPDVILQTHIAFSLSGKIASEETGVPLVLDDVTPSWEEKQQYGVGSQKLAEETHRAITEQARLCVAVSGPMQRFLEEDGIPPEKLIRVPNAIDERIFHADIDGAPIRRQYGFDDETLVIVFVGSFQPYHRVDLLIEAFSRVQSDRSTRLLLVGEGRMRPQAEALARRAGVADRVVFTGRVGYARVPVYVAAGDIAIMPATNTYGNPMKIYEYMALGKAVLAPDQDTITEIGTHMRDLYTFEPEDVASMAGALKTVIEADDLRAHLGEQAVRTITAEHTWTERGKTLLRAMERVI